MKILNGFVIGFLVIVTLAWAKEGNKKEFVVADFDSGESPNNLGGDFGTWNYDPDDETQGCLFFFEPDDHKNPLKGYCARLDDDVQSSNPAFNGFWMKLKGTDLGAYDQMSFWVKGLGDGKFTSRFKVELKNNLGERAVYVVENVTQEWQEITIDFKKASGINNWSQIEEFTFVFDDILATYKEGTIFIDHLSFRKVA
jgi:hypothetical protein